MTATLARDGIEAALRTLVGPAPSIDLRPSPFATGAPLAEADVRWPDGNLGRLVVKDLSTAARPAAGKPAFLHDPAREPYAYARLAGTDLGTARVHGVVDDGTAPRWLVLERVEGRRLEHTPAGASWFAAARWLGRLHRAGPGLVAGARGPLLAHDGDALGAWGEGAAARLGRGAPGWLRSYDVVAGPLAAAPATLVHGDYTPTNVLVRADGGICPVDWEDAGVGPGVLDLAMLTLGWDRPTVARLTAAYATALGTVLDRRLAELARLHCCVRWLGWGEGWEPPPSQRRDWWAEARRCAEEIGL